MFALAAGKNTVVDMDIHTAHRPLERPKNLYYRTQMYDDKTQGLVEQVLFFHLQFWIHIPFSLKLSFLKMFLRNGSLA